MLMHLIDTEGRDCYFDPDEIVGVYRVTQPEFMRQPAVDHTVVQRRSGPWFFFAEQPEQIYSLIEAARKEREVQP